MYTNNNQLFRNHHVMSSSFLSSSPNETATHYLQQASQPTENEKIYPTNMNNFRPPLAHQPLPQSINRPLTSQSLIFPNMAGGSFQPGRLGSMARNVTEDESSNKSLGMRDREESQNSKYKPKQQYQTYSGFHNSSQIIHQPEQMHPQQKMPPQHRIPQQNGQNLMMQQQQGFHQSPSISMLNQSDKEKEFVKRKSSENDIEIVFPAQHMFPQKIDGFQMGKGPVQISPMNKIMPPMNPNIPNQNPRYSCIFPIQTTGNPQKQQKVDKVEKVVDCQSTAGSGNEIQLKNYDFLKKKQEEFSSNKKQESGEKAVKDFLVPKLQLFPKKVQQKWPLSISPMEQKVQTHNSQYLSGRNPSPITTGYLSKQHLLKKNDEPGSPLQFKKRKATAFFFSDQNQFSSTQTPQSQPSQNQNSSFSKPSGQSNQNSQQPLTLRERHKAAKVCRQINLSQFQLIQKCGKGAFGDVFKAVQKVLGFICVIKKISKKKIKQLKVQEHILRQIKLQSFLNHCHLTSLYGFFDDEQYIYLIIELLPDGSLQQMKKKKKLPELQVSNIIGQVAGGIQYMHNQDIIHRDLKPQNLFMNQAYVKIGDFGCSIFNQSGLRNTIVGCLEYASPQQLNKTYYSDKIDCWSLGILTYELLIGRSPFQKDIKNFVQSQGGSPQLAELQFPENIPLKQITKEFIRKLLIEKPADRMSVDQVSQHPFVKLSQGTQGNNFQNSKPKELQ